MKTIRVYHLNNLSPSLFHCLKEGQMEAARVWNLCMQTHKDARMAHTLWPGRNELQQVSKGRYALHSQSVQMVVHAFIANIETTRKLRKEHPEMRMKYPWRIKTFYPIHWPAQAVSIEKGRVVLPMGKGRPSLVLPVQLPENAGACTLVWNRGFELHVCMEVPQAQASPGPLWIGARSSRAGTPLVLQETCCLDQPPAQPPLADRVSSEAGYRGGDVQKPVLF